MLKSSKALAMAMALILVVSVFLAGCGNNEGGQSQPTKTGEATTDAVGSKGNDNTEGTESAANLPEVRLSWYYPSNDLLGEENLVYDEVNKILKEKINATVDFKPISWGEYENKMKIMMAASEEFDILFTSNWFNNFQLAASKGNYLPLDDLLANYAPKTLASMSDDIWRATKLNGKIYAIPNQQIFARSSNMEMPKKFADKYGFNIDSVKRDTFKLEDLEPYLESFKNGEPDKYAFSLKWTELSGYYDMELLSGNEVPGAIYMKDDSLKVFNQFEAPEFMQNLETVNRWVEKGWFKSKELLAKKDQNLKPGEVFGGWFGGTWAPGGESQASQAYGTEIVRRPVSESILNNSGILATLTAISRTSKNPERAMMLLELMNNDEQLYNLLMWGIEGKHYTKNGNYIEPIKDAKYAAVPTWLLATMFRSYLIDGQPEDVWEQTKKVNEEAKPSPALGFTFDPTPVKTEVANASSVVKEYLEGLTYGILSVDKDYPVFIDKLKKAGSDKIVAEMQKQIDTWKASK